jgi:phosphatidylserine/phosphatidylglycerophosphate/cardiolipin synthase-like enzyme
VDFKLSHSEVLELRELLPQLQTDEISFVRNQAFLLARDQVVLGGPTALAALTWLEKIIKNIDIYRLSQVPSVSAAHFSPGEDCRNKLLALCASAQLTLDISIFTLADNRLAEAVIATHQRGIAVRIITDDQKMHDAGSDIEQLKRAGIAVRTDNSSAHMHHKFALIDAHTLVNGSFNWTRSASEYNQENILVTNEHLLVAAYREEFEKLWLEFA